VAGLQGRGGAGWHQNSILAPRITASRTIHLEEGVEAEGCESYVSNELGQFAQ